jgi:hypothetical protein
LPSKVHSSKSLVELANHEIVAIAVYLLGGRTKSVDTEDIAVKANDLAPGRFTWRKYSSQINLEIVRVYLSDAKKQAKGGYLSGSGTNGWSLTEKGFAFAKKKARLLASASLSREIIDPKEKRRRRGERARLLNSPAFQKCSEGLADSVSPSEAAAFFRIDDYVTSEMRRQRVTRIVNSFGKDPALGEAVLLLAHKVAET